MCLFKRGKGSVKLIYPSIHTQCKVQTCYLLSSSNPSLVTCINGRCLQSSSKTPIHTFTEIHYNLSTSEKWSTIAVNIRPLTTSVPYLHCFYCIFLCYFSDIKVSLLPYQMHFTNAGGTDVYQSLSEGQSQPFIAFILYNIHLYKSIHLCFAHMFNGSFKRTCQCYDSCLID